MTLFGKTIQGLRVAKNISQREAASDLGLSQALLSHYENGAREPKLGFIVKLCDYYGVTADYLLGRTKEKTIGEKLSGSCDCTLVDELSETLKKLNANDNTQSNTLEYIGAAILKMHNII